MAPFAKWLSGPQQCDSDLIVELVGESRKGLEKARKAFERGLAHLGLQVGVQFRGEELMDLPTVRFRISNSPIPSMGHGCDVLAMLGPKLPEGNPFGLQDRSVLLSDRQGNKSSAREAFPPGVIQYQVPFTELNRACGSLRGKGLIAVGLLTKLLDIPKNAIRPWVRPLGGFRYFDAGFRFASEQLCKKDVYVLPLPALPSSSILLNVEQALLLGLGLEICCCDEACVEGLFQESADDWIVSHVRKAGQVVISVRRPGDPLSAKRFQGRCPQVTGVTGISDPTTLARNPSNALTSILVPADISEVLQLTTLAKWRPDVRSDSFQIVVDEGLTDSSQTVPAQRVAEWIRATLHSRGGRVPQSIFSGSGLLAQREGESPADVGFVAWGSTQGVVRESLGLCQKFGMNVAALYPKVLWPFPADELEAFAATVKQLVVVEPNHLGNFTRFLRAHTCLEPSQILPGVGQRVNPMDIFLKEGFPGHSS